eukprot:6213192-Pleurochrysis_carterae.AAC.3
MKRGVVCWVIDRDGDDDGGCAIAHPADHFARATIHSRPASAVTTGCVRPPICDAGMANSKPAFSSDAPSANERDQRSRCQALGGCSPYIGMHNAMAIDTAEEGDAGVAFRGAEHIATVSLLQSLLKHSNPPPQVKWRTSSAAAAPGSLRSCWCRSRACAGARAARS